MARTYEGEFTVAITLTVEDEIIDRTQQEDWRRDFYTLDELDAVEMLMRNLVFRRVSLSQMDGWADAPDTAATVAVTDIDRDYINRFEEADR